MAARKIEVMSQNEMVLQAYEIETEIEVSEDSIELDQIETKPLSNVVSLADFRKSLGYSK